MINTSKIDNRTKCQITMAKNQPANGKGDISQTSIPVDPEMITAEELNAQLGQLGITFIDPGIAEQDALFVDKHPGSSGSGLKDIGSHVLDAGKDMLLWPLREAAYKICRKGTHNRYMKGKEIFAAITSKNCPDDYAGIYKRPVPSPVPSPDILGIYLCLKPNNLPISEYKPQNISDKADQVYNSIKSWSRIIGFKEVSVYVDHEGKYFYVWPTEFLRGLLQLEPGKIAYINGERYYESLDYPVLKTDIDLGNYFLSFGRDEKGVYLSVYDAWDFKPGAGNYDGKQIDGCDLSFLKKMEPRAMDAIGKPIYIYDRYYLSENEIKNEIERRGQEKFVPAHKLDKSGM